MARRLDDVRLAVLVLDGIELKGRTNIREEVIEAGEKRFGEPGPRLS